LFILVLRQASVLFEEALMSLNWMDVSPLSFNTLLLLERVQLSWFPGWLPEKELAMALQANPVVEWFMRHKCPDLDGWLDQVLLLTPHEPVDAGEVRKAEVKVLKTIEDLIVYVVEPAIYDTQVFNQWDSSELTSLGDFGGKVVIDIGAGTGRLSLVAAEKAAVVFAVEPVENLRRYIKEKAREKGYQNVYAVDGIITDIPFPDGFADVTMGGHVFGDDMQGEYQELMRVTKPGGIVILMGGGGKVGHEFLVSKGFQAAFYQEPGVEKQAKYWLVR
jgi:SAM-dependent methyltransferase